SQQRQRGPKPVVENASGDEELNKQVESAIKASETEFASERATDSKSTADVASSEETQVKQHTADTFPENADDDTGYDSGTPDLVAAALATHSRSLNAVNGTTGDEQVDLESRIEPENAEPGK